MTITEKRNRIDRLTTRMIKEDDKIQDRMIVGEIETFAEESELRRCNEKKYQTLVKEVCRKYFIANN
jgi:hypothetical protein